MRVLLVLGWLVWLWVLVGQGRYMWELGQYQITTTDLVFFVGWFSGGLFILVRFGDWIATRPKKEKKQAPLEEINNTSLVHAPEPEKVDLGDYAEQEAERRLQHVMREQRLTNLMAVNAIEEFDQTVQGIEEVIKRAQLSENERRALYVQQFGEQMMAKTARRLSEGGVQLHKPEPPKIEEVQELPPMEQPEPDDYLRIGDT